MEAHDAAAVAAGCSLDPVGPTCSVSALSELTPAGKETLRGQLHDTCKVRFNLLFLSTAEKKCFE